jgi:hypothetical protein
LCYFSTCEKNWHREEDRLGDFTRSKKLYNPVGTEIAMMEHNLGPSFALPEMLGDYGPLLTERN